MDPMAAIRATFFLECEEALAELEAGLMAIEAGLGDPETVNAIFRAVHSIKGGAGVFSLDALVRFAHGFETTLEALRSNRIAATPQGIAVMLRAADLLADLVRAARDDASVDAARSQALAAALAALIETPPGSVTDSGEMAGLDFEPVRVTLPPEPAEAFWRIRFRPLPELYAKGNEAGLVLRELARLGEMQVTLDMAGLPELAGLDPEAAYLGWEIRLAGDCDEPAIREVFDFVENECELEISRQAPEAPAFAPLPAAPGPVELGSAEPGLAAPGPAAPGPAAPGSGAAGLDAAAPAVATPAASGQAAAGPAAEAGAEASRTIRVDLDRVDRLIDLVGELVINEAMLNQRAIEAGMTRASAFGMALEELERLTHEIQDGVMAIRAQPVRSVFQRMPRLVRQVAAQTGKQVRLLTEGEATEVDKTVIERLADPLTHMIRNAIDHGLETPAQRRLAGKPPEGVVRLRALHRSGRIVIEIADDGAGIDRAGVRRKAVQNGLIAADAQLSDEETDHLIFMPGLSTSETVSDISGRGVGMDVVKRSVNALGGRIGIVSRPGLGSTFTLSLPLTLAVLDGMVVTAAGQTLIIPLGAILETLQPRAEATHVLGEQALIFMRGAYLPLIDIGGLLGFRNARNAVKPGVTTPGVTTPGVTTPGATTSGATTSGAAFAGQGPACVAILVENEAGSRSVLMVDEILGQRQVVIKSLEANYRAVNGVAGATVMGDGRVALILDVDVMVSEPPHGAETIAPCGGSAEKRILAEVN